MEYEQVLRTDLNNSKIRDQIHKKYVFSWQGVCIYTPYSPCMSTPLVYTLNISSTATIFDLSGSDSTGCGLQCWLDHDKPIVRQLPEHRLDFRFIVKFYTPDPGLLEEEYTRFTIALVHYWPNIEKGVGSVPTCYAAVRLELCKLNSNPYPLTLTVTFDFFLNLKTGTPVTPVLRNVDTNFGFSSLFCFRVGIPYGTEGWTGKTLLRRPRNKRVLLAQTLWVQWVRTGGIQAQWKAAGAGRKPQKLLG